MSKEKLLEELDTVANHEGGTHDNFLNIFQIIKLLYRLSTRLVIMLQVQNVCTLD